MISSNKVSISIVSHGQFTLLLPLIKSLRNCEEIETIIITINIPEKIKKIKWLDELPIIWIYNSTQQGFGTNHNNAFKMCHSKYFFVINPDVRLSNKIIKDLILLKEKEKINILGTRIVDHKKNHIVNARKFPNFYFLLLKVLYIPQKEYYFKESEHVLYTDWIGGMFLIFSNDDYKKLKGFDTKFFLYFEDVDLCRRARKLGLNVAQAKDITIVHEAQRQSYSNLNHFKFHIKSYFLYLKKYFLNYNL